MSAPTSAPLVKMPPPRRAKTEISEPPKPRPTSASTASLVSTSKIHVRIAVVAGDAEQRQADDEHAGDGAAAEGDVERRADAAARRLGDAGVGAHGHVHADEAGRRGRQAADGEADRDLDVLQRDQRDEQDDADDRRSSCTGAAGRPERPPGSAADSRCMVSLPGDSASSERVVTHAVHHGEQARRPRRQRAVVGQETRTNENPSGLLRATRNDGPFQGRRRRSARSLHARITGREPRGGRSSRPARSRPGFFGLGRCSDRRGRRPESWT